MEVIVYMELLSGHEKIITKSGISLNAGTLNRGFTAFGFLMQSCNYTLLLNQMLLIRSTY
jgi:hypothetical protein